MIQGKLIVLYGVNNLGKSTQAKIMVDRLSEKSLSAAYLKYPIYDLEPSGSLINEYLRHGNPRKFSSREFQIMMVMNRTQYDSELRDRLAAGEWIVAEDYIGTGIAWGMGAGVDKIFLEKLNQHLIGEDVGLLFDGKRFMQAQEKNHQHETDDDLTEKVRQTHQELAKDYSWPIVEANGTIEDVSAVVWRILTKKYFL
jgi:thymidylate kinase